MPGARRLVLGSIRFGSSVAFVFSACAASASVLASCSTDGEAGGVDATDAGTDVDATVDLTTSDAGPRDGSSPMPEAAAFDGGPLPVVCASPSCAKSLVTTISSYFGQEGFCALLEDRTVACWGGNDRGQLGRGDDAGTAGSAVAARVAGLSDIVQLASTCAVDASGASFCWGTGAYHQEEDAPTLLTTATTPVKLPLPPARSVSAYDVLGCAALVDGKVVCWGSNRNGQVAPYEVAGPRAALPPTEIAMPSGAPFQRVLVGDATFAVRSDGTMLSWGRNPPLGRVSSVAPDPVPSPISLERVSSVDLVGDRACATLAGTGYCWGPGWWLEGQLERALPQPVVAPEPLVQIATAFRPYTTEWRWCAVGASGDVYCWGSNAIGQAGDGTKDHAFYTVRVKGLPAPATQVKTTATSTCALLTNGKVYCWGSNSSGQLGSGMFKVPSLVPQEVVLP